VISLVDGLLDLASELFEYPLDLSQVCPPEPETLPPWLDAVASPVKY
jgi:hypothetical protein